MVSLVWNQSNFKLIKYIMTFPDYESKINYHHTS